MNYSAKQLVWGRAFLLTQLAAISVDPGAALLVAPKLRFSSDPAFNPTPLSTIALLAPQEATFSGYTAGGYTPALSAVVELPGVGVGKVANVVVVATTVDPFVPNDITGWWMDDGVNVVVAERFGAGVVKTFNGPGDFLDLLVAIAFPYYLATGL